MSTPRFTIVKENPCAIRDHGEGRNYHLDSQKEAMDLLWLLNALQEYTDLYLQKSGIVPKEEGMWPKLGSCYFKMK